MSHAPPGDRTRCQILQPHQQNPRFRKARASSRLDYDSAMHASVSDRWTARHAKNFRGLIVGIIIGGFSWVTAYEFWQGGRTAPRRVVPGPSCEFSTYCPALAISSFTKVKVVFNCPPKALTTRMMATEMPAGEPETLLLMALFA